MICVCGFIEVGLGWIVRSWVLKEKRDRDVFYCILGFYDDG